MRLSGDNGPVLVHQHGGRLDVAIAVLFDFVLGGGKKRISECRLSQLRAEFDKINGCGSRRVRDEIAPLSS
jgi:hypothetical protein